MTLEQQRDLTDRLDRASQQYYHGEQTEFTDEEFDLRLKELMAVEKQNNQIFPNSPTQRVGCDIQEGFKKWAHPEPMLTISNVYTNDELTEWVKKRTDGYYNTLLAGIKYDGVSLELHYHNGVLKRAVTRGDKIIGDDVTENAKTIKSIPLVIAHNRVPTELYVRGEVLMPKSQLEALNAEKIANSEKPFANARNACSGSLKQLDPKVTAARGLVFKPWDWYCLDENMEPAMRSLIIHKAPGAVYYSSMYEKMKILSEWGFEYNVSGVEVGKIIVRNPDIENIVADMWQAIKSANLDYDYDGMVIKVDNLEQQMKLGTVDYRSVDWAIARKWNEEYEVTTRVNSVDWQVGKTGVVTPVANLEPVMCGGVEVSRATLNNEAFITNLDLHYGDTVKIVRSGGVIPYILEVTARDKNGEPVRVPEKCPECGTMLYKDHDLWKCPNTNCKGRVLGRMLHWCSKDCMDVRGMGESILNDIIHAFHFTEPFELYNLLIYSTDDILGALGDGYGEKTINNIKESLLESTKKPLANIIYGLSIDGIGKVTARDLVKRFKTWDGIEEAVRKDRLKEISGIGSVLEFNILFWFLGPEDDEVPEEDYGPGLMVQYRKTPADVWKEELTKYGFCLNPEVMEVADGPKSLAGLTVVFTGKSKRFPGDDVEEYLESFGAKTSHSVSSKTSYLITGEKPGGSKVAKANSLGINVITEDDFFAKYHLV